MSGHYKDFCAKMEKIANDCTWNAPWIFGRFWIARVAPICEEFEALAGEDEVLRECLDEGHILSQREEGARKWLESFMVEDSDG